MKIEVSVLLRNLWKYSKSGSNQTCSFIITGLLLSACITPTQIQLLCCWILTKLSSGFFFSCDTVSACWCFWVAKRNELTPWKFGCPIQIFNTNQVDFLQFCVEPAGCLEHSAKSVVTVTWRTKWPSLAVATTAGSASQYSPWSLIKVFMLHCFSEQAGWQDRDRVL